MNVSDEIFPPLVLIYHNFSQSDDKDVFLVHHRRRIKILVDSLWEQIVESVFKQKPRNAISARRLINADKHMIKNAEDAIVIEELGKVLRNYDVLVEKAYIDLSVKLRPLFMTDLKSLCQRLANHPNYATNEKAKKLNTVLGKV